MTNQIPALVAIADGRVVPVVVLNNAADAIPLGRALHAGHLNIAEVTFRTPAAASAISHMASITDLVVGAGTVIRPDQVDQAVDAGAQFIVSPGLSAEVVERCNTRGVPVIPGVATASDIIAALDLGIEIMKFFPAETSGGVPALRALSAPFPHVRFVPTGGVSAQNATAYLDLPSVMAVGGSWMVSPTLIQAGDFTEITKRARSAAELVTHGSQAKTKGS